MNRPFAGFAGFAADCPTGEAFPMNADLKLFRHASSAACYLNQLPSAIIRVLNCHVTHGYLPRH